MSAEGSSFRDQRARNDRSRGGGRYSNGRGRNSGGYGGIPDRWLNYDAIGRDIEGSRFVPFKTPLHSRYFEGKTDLHEDDYFDVRTLLQFTRDAGKRIGLVIDLTNTDRYYDKSEWKQYDIEYFKITCPGHEVNTREDIVETFFERVDAYLAESNDDSLIGVHCTHGLNRTGYLICRYLIDKMGWTAARAISQFEYNRGHPIERGHYKQSLYSAEKRIIQEGPSYNSVKDATSKDNERISKGDASSAVTGTENEGDFEVKKGEEKRIQDPSIVSGAAAEAAELIGNVEQKSRIQA